MKNAVWNKIIKLKTCPNMCKSYAQGLLLWHAMWAWLWSVDVNVLGMKRREK